MKKSFLFLCLICLSFYSFSQTVGIRGGINNANQAWKINGEKMRSTDMIGGLGTLSINIEQSEKTSGQLEFSYSQMGFGETHIGDSIKVLAGQYKYIKLGCALKFHILRSTNLHIGPELGFQFEHLKDLRFLYNPDFGIFIGGEQYFNPYIGAGARYYLGLSNLNNSAPIDGFSIKQLNRSIQVYVAFRFPGRQLKEMGY